MKGKDVLVEINGNYLVFEGPAYICDIREKIFNNFNFSDFYISLNGKVLKDESLVDNGYLRATLRLRGGKGGFGSMLRAIGAQIEKTTNREACRDLSGRRLRDINEEKRLKNWISQQAEREREAAERRKKKLERLCIEPKHDFTDQSYEKERSELSEKVYDAVEQGFRSASTSSSCPKRKLETEEKVQKKKKSCLWVDDVDEDDLSSLDSSDSECEVTTKTVEVSQGGTKTEESSQCDKNDIKDYQGGNSPKTEESGNIEDFRTEQDDTEICDVIKDRQTLC